MKRNYCGWMVWGEGDYWSAIRFGVRMRANSESLIISMINRKVDDERKMEKAGGFWATLFNPSLLYKS